MKRLGKHSIYTSSSHKRWVYIPIVLIVIISWMCMNETHINAFLHDVKSSSAMAEGNELRNSNDSRNSNDLRPSGDLRDFDSRGFRNLHVKNVDFRGENDTKISNKSMFAFAHAYVRLKITIDGFTREFAKNLKTVRVNIPSYNSTNNSRLYRNFLALSEDVEVNYKENSQIKSLPLDAFTSYTINLTLKNEGIYDLSKITVKSVSLRYPSHYRIYSNSKNYDSENNADDGISGNVVADNDNADNSSFSISNFDNNQSFIRYIVIDNTRPKISVKYEDNNSRDMQYFNTRRIAHVTIQDENFALVKSLEPSTPIAVNSFNNNKVILTASDFTKEDTSKKWHATANYDDGFWCVLYGFVDLSGNKSEILKNSFIVDSRASNAGITNTGSNEKRASGSRDGGSRDSGSRDGGSRDSGSRDSGSRASGSRDSDVDSSNSDAIRSDAATDRNRASSVNNDSNNNTRNSNDSKYSSANVGNSKSAKKEATNENLNKSNKARKDDLAEKSVKASVKKIKRSSNNTANSAANGSANKRVSQKVGRKDSLKSAHNRKSDDINKRDSSPKRVEESNASDVPDASDASSASKKQEKDEDSSNKTVQKTKDKSAEKNENDSEVSNTKSNKSVKKNKNVSRSVYRLHPRWKAILKDHNRAIPHDMADAIRLNRSARKSYAKKDSSKRASADSSNKSSTKSKKSSGDSANHDDSEEYSANKDKTSDKDSDSDKGDDIDKDSGSKSDDDKNSEDSKDKNKDDSENQGEISNEHSNKKLTSEDKSFSNNPSKNNNAGLLIAIAVIIVSVSGVCVVGYFVYRHDGKLFGN